MSYASRSGSCPDEAAIQLVVEGNATTQERASVLIHSEQCDLCRAVLADFMRDSATRRPLAAELSNPLLADTAPAGESHGDLHQPLDLNHVEDAPLERLDEYRLVRRLGRGAMGQVWLGIDTLLDRPVAIKWLAAPVPEEAARMRFQVEAQAIARLNHPNVAGIYRFGEAAGRRYLVSEFVRGESLDQLPKPVPKERALAIAMGLARGLSAAHRSGVLHRDIKPANVVLAEDGEVKLLDFGLAKLLERPAWTEPALYPGDPGDALREAAGQDGPAATRGPLSMTREGTLLGTPLYMAPEMWLGEPATRRCDVYSLGALLYELCSGAPPHRGSSLEELRRAVKERDPAPLLDAAPSIDPRFAAVVDRCLRRDPLRRFASGQEVYEALAGLAGPRPRRRLLLGLVLGGAALVGGLWISARTTSREHPAALEPHLLAGDRVGTNLQHWNGRDWTVTPNPALNAVWDLWGRGANEVWAVGAGGTVLRWNGGTWSLVDCGTHQNLVAVWGPAPPSSTTWVAGADGLILRFHEGRWERMPSGTQASLLDLWGSGSDDIWAVGDSGTTLHWDGAAWSLAPSATGYSLNGVWGDAGEFWAVGWGGTILHRRGGSWTVAASGTTEKLWSVWGSGPMDVWAVGSRGTLLHWNGAAWRSVPSGTKAHLTTLWGRGTAEVWAAGASGTLLRWDGRGWSGVPGAPAGYLFSLWGNADDLWVGGPAD